MAARKSVNGKVSGRKSIKAWHKTAAAIIFVFAVILFALIVWPGGSALGLINGQTCIPADPPSFCNACTVNGEVGWWGCPPCEEIPQAGHCSITGTMCYSDSECTPVGGKTWGAIKGMWHGDGNGGA